MVLFFFNLFILARELKKGVGYIKLKCMCIPYIKPFIIEI